MSDVMLCFEVPEERAAALFPNIQSSEFLILYNFMGH